MKKIGFYFLAGIAGLLAVIILRTLLISGGPSRDIEALAAPSDYDENAIARHISGAIRFQTISWGPGGEYDKAAFQGFAAYLERTYPAAHAAMSRETVNDMSLLYRWRGSDPAAKPIGLMAHIDVVPVEQGTDDLWTRPAFSGDIYDGAVWGRGALDDKGQLIIIMEAIERLARDGFEPTRDIYLMFGHDEEVGGETGAGAISALLESRGVRLAWTLDEGSGVVQGIIPGIESPVALISIAEKGSTTLAFVANAEGGHSSAPGKDTAVSLAARAVVAVTDNPHPQKLDQNLVTFLHVLAPELPFPARAALANLWLTGPLIKKQLASDPATAAALHTTTAPTIIEGGEKLNILPQEARAVVNYRIHPRDSAESVRARAERLIGDDRINVEVLGALDPSPQSSKTSDGYKAIEAATAAIFGDIPISPFLTLQGTDTRHYVGIADDNYRFAPFIFESEDLARIHGNDERIKIALLAPAAAWYEDVIRRAAN